MCFIKHLGTTTEISVAQWQIKHQQKICRSSYNEQKRLSSQFPAFQSEPFFFYTKSPFVAGWAQTKERHVLNTDPSLLQVSLLILHITKNNRSS